MSSSETVLQDARPERPGEFTFTWSIHNYSFCTLEEGECLCSPDFVVDFLGHSKWWLELYPRGYEAPGFVSCYLCGSKIENFKFTLSVRAMGGHFKETIEMNKTKYHVGCSDFIRIENLEGPKGYLENDTLTLRCRIWREDTDIPTSTKCDVHSKFKVSKLNYTWLLKDIPFSTIASECEFNQSCDIRDLSKELPNFRIQLINEGGSSENDIYFGIEMDAHEDSFYFLKRNVHILDATGRAVHSESGQYFFEASTEEELFKFIFISKHKFYANKNIYAPKGQLTLKCEFSFSQDNELHTFVYQTTNNIKLLNDVPEPNTEEHQLWMDNMRKCYEDGKFSDFVIRTATREFPVSRTILGAHSEVFCSMFERDMKERQTGVAEIEDCDDDTISKMLAYVHTGALGSIDCAAAQKLYLAADKYRITALQQKCSKYLIGCIDEFNVCDILELADALRDLDLIYHARFFIQTHAKQILNSESWKKLMGTNPSLTSETMHWILCNKFLF